MARGELIKKLFASRGRDDEFVAVAQRIIAEEEKKGNVVLARSMRKLLDAPLDRSPSMSEPAGGQSAGPQVSGTKAAGQRSGPKALAPLIPFPDPAADLVERIEPSHVAADVILTAENIALFQGLLAEFRRGDDIRRRGLSVRSRLLFCGPPGTGKTLTAEVFAAELKLPLYVVKLDRLMSSFLGETAANVRKVFEFARTQPCVLFLDEFDALARAREDTSEHSELRRVVNSLLLFIERIAPNGFLIAATNLESALDDAIYRRFDEVIWFDLPTKTQVSRFLQRKFRNVATAINPTDYVEAFADYSLAEIEKACVQAIKAPIIAKRAKIENVDMRAAIRDMARRRRGVTRLKPKAAVSEG